jgi:hypothetical protein
MARGRISNEEAQQILQDVADKGDYWRNKTGDPDAFRTVADNYIAALKAESVRQRDMAIRGATARKEGLKLTLGGDVWTKGGDAADAATRLRSIMVNENGWDYKGSVMADGNATIREFHNYAWNALVKAGLTKYIKRPDALGDISQAIMDLKAGQQVRGGPAKQAAQIILNTFEGLRKLVVAQGARDQNPVDRAFHTVWDPELILKGGMGQRTKLTSDAAFQKFYETMDPRFDPMDDLIPRKNEDMKAARLRFWRSAFDAIATGIHEDPKILSLGPEYEGTYNILRRLEDSRVFRPKSGTAWAEAIKLYGAQQTPAEFLLKTIESYARDAAMLKRGGPNFAANMRQVMQTATTAMRDAHDVEASRKYQEILSGTWDQRLLNRPGLDGLLAQMGAIRKTPMNGLKYDIIDSMMKFINVSTLGALAQTHFFSAFAPFTQQARLNGVNSFAGLARLFSSMAPMSAARRELLDQLGAYNDGLFVTNPMAGRSFSAPGVLSYMNSALMTASGFRYTMRHLKNGMIFMLSNNLANNMSKAFGEIRPELRERMLAYGIDENKWKLMQRASQTKGYQGRNYVTPDAIYQLNNDFVRSVYGQIAPEAIDKLKGDLAHQMLMYLTTSADHAVVTPGVREQALLRNIAGVTPMSFFTQFTAWPIAAFHQLAAKNFAESLSLGKAAWGLGLGVGLGMLGGYLRMQALNLEGNRPIDNPQTIGEAIGLMTKSLALGGYTGIIGDYFLGGLGQATANRPAAFGGPVVGDVTALADMARRLADSELYGTKYNLMRDATHYAASRIPFANLFYLKAALDYMVFYHMFEAAQPGWWERTNQARIKQGKGGLAGYSPGTGIPFNPLTPLQNIGVGG